MPAPGAVGRAAAPEANVENVYHRFRAQQSILEARKIAAGNLRTVNFREVCQVVDEVFVPPCPPCAY